MVATIEPAVAAIDGPPLGPSGRAEHGLDLARRDRRALETYRALDVHVELLA